MSPRRTDGRRAVVGSVILGLGAAAVTVSFLPSPKSVDPSACSPDELRSLDYSDPGQGELSWADEFDGDSVDTTRWTVRDRTSLSFDQAAIRADNVTVHDGRLVIEARRQRAGGRDYTTGYLDTIGHFSQRHGRWEMRARLPVKKGSSRSMWPAFWLRADDAYGEIDVMEAWGTPADHPRTRPERYAWHVHQDTRHPTDGPDGSVHGWGATQDRSSLRDAFHEFAVDWSPTCLKFTMDGRVTGSVAMDARRWLERSLRGTVNIRLNLQVGSHYWGRADEARPHLTDLPAAFDVDYVRVYRSRE
jgi:hypothetical protein